jgi:hypothetical protein
MTNSVTTTLSPSGLRGFHVTGPTSTGPAVSRFPTFSGCLTRVLPTAPSSSATGLDSWLPLIGVSRFAIPYGKSSLHSKTPICRTPTMLDPLTRVPQMMDGPDCIGESRIAISLCTNLLSPGTPIPRSPTLRDPLPRVPAVWTAQIPSGNRGSRFPIATVLHP